MRKFHRPPPEIERDKRFLNTYKIHHRLQNVSESTTCLPKTMQQTQPTHDLRTETIQTLHNKWPDGRYIYTDGSKMNGRTACAYYDETSKSSGSKRIWNDASTYSAELYAVWLAVEYIKSIPQQSPSNVIISDSQSVLQKIKNFGPGTDVGAIERNIMREIHMLKTQGKEIAFVWVRGHVNIHGNEEADRLAKQATNNQEEIIDPVFPSTDLYQYFNQEARTKWHTEYRNYHAGKKYVDMFPTPPRQPWFQNCQHTSKRFYKIISRIRCGTSVTNLYLNRIGGARSAACRFCSSSDETIEHVVMMCPALASQQRSLMEILISSLPQPMSISTIIISQKQEVYDAIFVYFSSINFNP